MIVEVIKGGEFIIFFQENVDQVFCYCVVIFFICNVFDFMDFMFMVLDSIFGI